jgi:hypothetical protein
MDCIVVVNMTDGWMTDCCFYFCTETAFQNNRPQQQQVVVYTSGAPSGSPAQWHHQQAGVAGAPVGVHVVGAAGYPVGGYPINNGQYGGHGGAVSPVSGAFPQEGQKQAAPMPQGNLSMACIAYHPCPHDHDEYELRMMLLINSIPGSWSSGSNASQSNSISWI